MSPWVKVLTNFNLYDISGCFENKINSAGGGDLWFFKQKEELSEAKVFFNVEPPPPVGLGQRSRGGGGGGEIRDLKDKTLIKTDLFTKGF